MIIAPDADEAARAIIAKQKNLRLLLTDGLPDAHDDGLSVRNVAGGYLVQNRDNGHVDVGDVACVTKRQPAPPKWPIYYLPGRSPNTSNPTPLSMSKIGATVGIGAGQMSRLDSSRIAARKSADAAEASGAAAPLGTGLGGCLGCVFSVCRRAARRSGSRCDSNYPTGRLYS